MARRTILFPFLCEYWGGCGALGHRSGMAVGSGCLSPKRGLRFGGRSLQLCSADLFLYETPVRMERKYLRSDCNQQFEAIYGNMALSCVLQAEHKDMWEKSSLLWALCGQRLGDRRKPSGIRTRPCGLCVVNSEKEQNEIRGARRYPIVRGLPGR